VVIRWLSDNADSDSCLNISVQCGIYSYPYIFHIQRYPLYTIPSSGELSRPFTALNYNAVKVTWHSRLTLQTYHDVLRHTTTPDTCTRPKHIVKLDEG